MSPPQQKRKAPQSILNRLNDEKVTRFRYSSCSVQNNHDDDGTGSGNNKHMVEPGFNEVPRGCGNWFMISRVCYIEAPFHTLHYYWAEKYCSLNQGLCYIEVR